MENPENVSILVAFVAGVLSFLSPCILPLVPSYLSYIAGMSFEEMKDAKLLKRGRLTIFVSALFFVLGLSTVFILLGAPLIFLSRVLSKYSYLFQKIGGIIVIFFGLYILGILKVNFLSQDRRVLLDLKRTRLKYLGAFLIGCAFGFAWSPCLGPILSSILILSATSQTAAKGFFLLTTYSLGLAIPFLISALALNLFLSFLSRFRGFMGLIQKISGLVLIFIGFLIFTDRFNSVIPR